MTPDDVHNLIQSISVGMDGLDRKHLKQLYNLLIARGGNIEHKCRHNAQCVLEKLDEIATKLEKHDIKKLYRVAIECDMAPKCFACNQPIKRIKDFSWDHVYPHSKGGSDDLSNLVPMHKSCNERKGAQIFEDVLSVQYTLVIEQPVVVIIERQELNRYKKKRYVKRLKPWQHHDVLCKKR